MAKRYSKKDLVPRRYRLRITRDELVGLLNVVKYSAESCDWESLTEFANKIIEKYKEG